EMFLLSIVTGKVGMDTFGYFTKKGLQAERWIELFDFVRISERSIMGFLRPFTCFIGPMTSSVGVVEVDLALCNAGFDVVQFSVENTYLAEVAVFEDLELGAQLGHLSFTISKLGTNDSEFLALVDESYIVRSLLEDDFRWHMVSRV